MQPSIILGTKHIKPYGKPYLIAEIGVNHEGSLDGAMRLIDAAKRGGADAAKFQSYKASTLASKNSPAYWDINKEATLSQYELFKKYDNFSPDDYVKLANHCNEVGIDFLSTPFDDSAIDFLYPLVPFFKIASADLTNTPFLRKIAKKGKPIVLSTGASTLSEINTAINTIKEAGCSNLALLHCILNYPTSNENAHLLMIRGLMHAYPNNIVGYSDHTLPDDSMTTLVTAYLLGAVILEKHFTNNKTLKGNDHYHAMDEFDLATFIKKMDSVRNLMGPTEQKSPILSEENSRKNARRSIVVIKNVSAGQKILANDLTYKRPGSGISPLHWDQVVGSIATKNLFEDDILQWGDIRLISA